MMARATPNLSMRPMLPGDAPLLAQIFRASIEEVASEDYSEAQCEAWASAADDEEAFGKRLGEQLTLIAMMDGAPVGFASLKGNERLDMLYVHPAATGLGAASMLVDALEKLAKARGASKLTVDASDTAHDFFRSRGYVAQSRKTVLLGEEWLANTTMEKPLGAGNSEQGNQVQ
jgi:putative acetyltransferase